MKPLNLNDVIDYVENHIGIFHQKRIESLNKLKLNKILCRKNPYLFKAKHITTAADLVKSIANAHISSNEEAIFGDWLEGLAIFINANVYDGRKRLQNSLRWKWLCLVAKEKIAESPNPSKNCPFCRFCPQLALPKKQRDGKHLRSQDQPLHQWPGSCQ